MPRKKGSKNKKHREKVHRLRLIPIKKKDVASYGGDVISRTHQVTRHYINPHF